MERKIKITLTRDSVAAGDDMDAPHLFSFTTDVAAQLKDLFEQLADCNYLPLVAGRGHSWQATTKGQIIANFVANRFLPEFSTLLFAPMTDFAVDDELPVHFRYQSAPY